MGLKSRFLEIASHHGVESGAAEGAYVVARHFIRQAQDYYFAARAASATSAPLLQYYGILNLAKFALAATCPEKVKQRRQLQHGLRVEGDASPPQAARLIASEGIFSTLTEQLVEEPPASSLSVDELLARTIDVAAEYVRAWKKPIRSTIGVITSRADDGTKWWIVVDVQATSLVPDASAIEYTGSPLKYEFRQVVSNVPSLLRFESNVDAPAADDPVLRKLVRRLRPSLSSGEYKEQGWPTPWRVVQLPYRLPGGKPPLPEMSTIYAVSFYLADIVRYHPNILADDSTSTDPWVLESFARSGPAKFARLALNYLMAGDIRMEQT